jgi:ankyrin repeat protein
MGQKEIVKTLLEHNADGRIHPVTKYSPLYIACYNGKKDIVELLLKVSRLISQICFSDVMGLL